MRKKQNYKGEYHKETSIKRQKAKSFSSAFFHLHTDINNRIIRKGPQTVFFLAVFLFWNGVLLFSREFSADASYKELIYRTVWEFTNNFDLTHKTSAMTYYPLMFLNSLTNFIFIIVYLYCFFKYWIGATCNELHLKFLSMIFSAFFWLFYIPKIQIGLNVFSCYYSKFSTASTYSEEKCYCNDSAFPFILALSIINLLITFYIGIISSVFTYQLSLFSNDYLRRLSFSYSITLFSGTSYFLLYKIMSQKEELTNLLRNINYAALISFELYCSYLLAFKYPFFHKRVNVILLIKSSVWIFTCVSDVTVLILNSLDLPSYITSGNYFLVSPLICKFAYNIANYKHKNALEKIYKEDRVTIEEFLYAFGAFSLSELIGKNDKIFHEDDMRLIGLFNRDREHSAIVSNNEKSIKESWDPLFLKYKAKKLASKKWEVKFSKISTYYIALSLFMTLEVKNLIKGYRLYKKAQATCSHISNFMNNFLVFQLKREVSERFMKSLSEKIDSSAQASSELNLDQFLTYEKHINELMKQISSVVSYSTNFWREMLKSEISMKVLFNHHSTLSKNRDLVHVGYKNIHSHVHKHHYPIKNHLLIYGVYLIHLEFRVMDGESFLKQASMKNLKKGLDTLGLDTSANQKKTVPFFKDRYFFDGSAVVIKTSLAEQEIKKIKAATTSCLPIFGLSTKQLINCDFDLLLPKIFKEWHDKVVLTYIEKDQRTKNSIDIARTFAKHGDGSVFPVLKLTRLSPYLYDGIYLMTMFMRDFEKRDFAYILTDSTGKVDSVSSELVEMFQLKQGEKNAEPSIFKFCKQLEPVYKLLNSASKREFKDLLESLGISERRNMPEGLRKIIEIKEGEKIVDKNLKEIKNIIDYLKEVPLELKFCFPNNSKTISSSEYSLTKRSKQTTLFGNKTLRSLVSTHLSNSTDEFGFNANISDILRDGEHVVRVIKLQVKEVQANPAKAPPKKIQEFIYIPAVNENTQKENSESFQEEVKTIKILQKGKKTQLKIEKTSNTSDRTSHRDFCDVLLNFHSGTYERNKKIELEESSVNRSSSSTKQIRNLNLLYSAINKRHLTPLLFSYNIYQSITIILFLILFSVTFSLTREIFGKSRDLINIVRESENRVDIIFSIYQRTKTIEYVINGMGKPDRWPLMPGYDTISFYILDLKGLAAGLITSQFYLRNFLNERGEQDIIKVESRIINIYQIDSDQNFRIEQMSFFDSLKLLAEKVNAVGNGVYLTIKDEEYRYEALKFVNKNILNDPLLVSEYLSSKLYELVIDNLEVFQKTINNLYSIIWGFIGLSVIVMVIFSLKYTSKKCSMASLILSVSDQDVEEIISRLNNIKNLFTKGLEENNNRSSDEPSKDKRNLEKQYSQNNLLQGTKSRARRVKTPNFRGFTTSFSFVFMAIMCLALYYFILTLISYLNVRSNSIKNELWVQRVKIITKRHDLQSSIGVTAVGMFDPEFTVKGSPGVEMLASSLQEYMSFDEIYQFFFQKKVDDNDNSFKMLNERDFCNILTFGGIVPCYDKEFVSKGLINMESMYAGKVLKVFNQIGTILSNAEGLKKLFDSPENIDSQESLLRSSYIYKDIFHDIAQHFYSNIENSLNDLNTYYIICVIGIVFVYLFVLLRQMKFAERRLHEVRTVFMLIPPENLQANKIIMNFFYKNTNDSQLKRIFKVK